MSSLPRRGLVHLGMDVSKDSISVGILRPEDEIPVVEKVFHDEESVRRLVNRLGGPRGLIACYEAGPTGYELHRLLRSLGVRCDVVAPSLIPKTPGDRVKTDKRDARRLARLHRAGELVAIRVPSVAEEAIRDGCRARADMVDDLNRARRRLGAFLLRHGRVYRDGKSAWTYRHEQWLRSLRFEERTLQVTFDHYLAVVTSRGVELDAMEAELVGWVDHPLFADQVVRMGAYRGIAKLGALTIASEVCDWRRFPNAGSFMSFVGLTVSEHSTGASVRRGRLTKSGNSQVRTQLIESAWAYQHRPAVGLELRRRQQGLPAETIARSWAAQQRLCGRFRHLQARKNNKTVVVAAVARELAGFVWAEMVA